MATITGHRSPPVVLAGLLALLALLALAVPLARQAAAQDASAREELRREIARDLVVHHALPRYEALTAETAALDGAARTFCADPTPDGLDAVHEAYADAFEAWMAIQHVRFGPVMREDRYYRLEYWPDKHGQGGRQLRKLFASGDLSAMTPETLADKSVALQGFPALERILYGKNAESRLTSGDETAAGLCRFATAITGNLKAMAAATETEWRDGPAAQANDMDAETVDQTLKDFFQAFTDELQFIRLSKLGEPLGETPGQANPRAAEAWRSGLSLPAIQANLAGLHETFSGNEEAGSKGLGAALNRDEADGDYRRSVARGLLYGIDFIDDHPDLLTAGLKSEEGRKSIAFLMLHLDGVRERAAGTLGGALGVDLGFNAMDGD